AARARCAADVFHCPGGGGVARLERAFAQVVATAPLRERMHKAHVRDIDAARAQGLITDAEAEKLRAAASAVAAAIAVDDFAPSELSPRKSSPRTLQATGTISLQTPERQPTPVAGGGS